MVRSRFIHIDQLVHRVGGAFEKRRCFPLVHDVAGAAQCSRAYSSPAITTRPASRRSTCANVTIGASHDTRPARPP